MTCWHGAFKASTPIVETIMNGRVSNSLPSAISTFWVGTLISVGRASSMRLERAPWRLNRRYSQACAFSSRNSDFASPAKSSEVLRFESPMAPGGPGCFEASNKWATCSKFPSSSHMHLRVWSLGFRSRESHDTTTGVRF